METAVSTPGAVGKALVSAKTISYKMDTRCGMSGAPAGSSRNTCGLPALIVVTAVPPLEKVIAGFEAPGVPTSRG